MKAARRMRPGLLLVAAALMLGACGNGPNDRSDVLKMLPSIFKKKEAPAPLAPQVIAQALAATDKPVQFYEIESRKLQFLMLEIQRNGPYQSYGSSSRQVIAMRDGMITSTRGLGGDLMSSDVDSLLPRVRARAAGSAQYDMRFLTSEDVIEVKRYVCRLQPGGRLPVQGGVTDSSGTMVKADCTGVGHTGRFTNTYIVAADGHILSARQWLGSMIGYVAHQALRR